MFVAGGLGANPHPAQALEEFTAREDLMPTIEAVLRTFDHFGNRYNKLRARLKWVVDELGIDELRRRILRERQLLVASSSWPGGIPSIVEELGDAPAGVSATVDPTPVGTPVTLRVNSKQEPYARWKSSNVIVGVAKGTVSAIAYARLGDITSDQFRSLAGIVRDFGVDVRVTNRQNFALRGLSAEQLPELYHRLEEAGMAEPGAELAHDVVACPGADTCNLAVTQSRGLAADIGRALEESGLADVGGVRINISGCTNSCGQHHIADIGFNGAERRAHGVPAPATSCCSAVGSAKPRSSSATVPCACRPRRRRRPRSAWSAGSPMSVRPARRSANGSTGSEGPRFWAPSSRTLTTGRHPRSGRITTWTSTRPGRTWPRSARANAPPVDRDRTGHETLEARLRR